MKLLFRKVMRIMLITIGVLVVCAFILAGALWLRSPGKVQPFLDENGNPLAWQHFMKRSFVEINGVQQGMIIKSKDAANPVLLYLHGGMPEYFLTQKYPTGLEDYFTVVWWEQRGSGFLSPPISPQRFHDPGAIYL